MGRYVHIIGGSLRRVLYSKFVTFLTNLADQPSPMYRGIRGKSKMTASYFCIQPYDRPKVFTSLFR